MQLTASTKHSSDYTPDDTNQLRKFLNCNMKQKLLAKL